jgi:hypothetical protein
VRSSKYLHVIKLACTRCVVNVLNLATWRNSRNYWRGLFCCGTLYGAHHGPALQAVGLVGEHKSQPGAKLTGVAFCYFFVFGQVFKFIQSFAPKSITAAPDIEAYLDFVLSMFLAFGMAFEVPIVVIVLARMGIVSIEKLKAFRSYFIVVAFVVAAIVTPPDVVSQLALAIPMCILYEIGIWAAQIFIRHTQAPPEEEVSPR